MLKNITSNIRTGQVFLIVFAVIVIIGISASGIFIRSDLSPLYVGLIPLTIITIVVFGLSKPVWALYLTLMVIFLPPGLIPDAIQSNLNRILTVAALVVWLFHTIFQRRRKIIWGIEQWFFTAFLVWGLVTFFWTPYVDASQQIFQVYLLRFVLFFIVLINQIRTEKDLDQLMMVLALIGWVVVVTSIATVIVSGYLPGTRIHVLDANANALGVTALIALPGILWKTMQPRKSVLSLNHILAILYFILAIVLIAVSGSRGSAISFVISILILLYFRPTRPWALVCLVILLLAAICAPFIFTATIDRFSGTSGETTWGGREYTWSAGIDLISDHPLLGVGIGNASYEVMPYLMMYESISGYTRSSLHNPILMIWADTGIPGLIMYLGILVSCILSTLHVYQSHRQNGLTRLIPFISVVMAVFLGYMTSWIKGGSMELDQSYYLMLALLMIPANLGMAPSLKAPR